jgi:myosin-crossreactive antigen
MYSQLSRAYSISETVKASRRKLNAIDTSSCAEITEESLKRFSKMERIEALRDRNASSRTTVEQYNNYVNQVLNYLKQCGVAFETCPNCGADVLIDIDKIGSYT